MNIQEYLERNASVVYPYDMFDRVHGILAIARSFGRTVWCVGNGGSASTASHAACDLTKQVGIRAIALTDLVAQHTAYANDEGQAQSLCSLLDALADSGDVLFLFSVSGKSENILKLVPRYAQVSVAFTRPDTPLAERCDHALCVDSDDYGIVENAHLAMVHALCYALRTHERTIR